MCGKTSRTLSLSQVQYCGRRSIQKGYVPLPKSVKPARIKSNVDVFSFQLGSSDMATLDGLEERLVTGWDPVSRDPV